MATKKVKAEDTADSSNPTHNMLGEPGVNTVEVVVPPKKPIKGDIQFPEMTDAFKDELEQEMQAAFAECCPSKSCELIPNEGRERYTLCKGGEKTNLYMSAEWLANHPDGVKAAVKQFCGELSKNGWPDFV